MPRYRLRGSLMFEGRLRRPSDPSPYLDLQSETPGEPHYLASETVAALVRDGFLEPEAEADSSVAVAEAADLPAEPSDDGHDPPAPEPATKPLMWSEIQSGSGKDEIKIEIEYALTTGRGINSRSLRMGIKASGLPKTDIAALLKYLDEV